MGFGSSSIRSLCAISSGLVVVGCSPQQGATTQQSPSTLRQAGNTGSHPADNALRELECAEVEWTPKQDGGIPKFYQFVRSRPEQGKVVFKVHSLYRGQKQWNGDKELTRLPDGSFGGKLNSVDSVSAMFSQDYSKVRFTVSRGADGATDHESSCQWKNAPTPRSALVTVPDGNARANSMLRDMCFDVAKVHEEMRLSGSPSTLRASSIVTSNAFSHLGQHELRLFHAGDTVNGPVFLRMSRAGACLSYNLQGNSPKAAGRPGLWSTEAGDYAFQLLMQNQQGNLRVYLDSPNEPVATIGTFVFP